MRDFIERLKSKPEHIRRRIALGTSLGITGVVAAVWAFALVFSGTLSYATTPSNTSGTIAQSDTSSGSNSNSSGQTNFTQLLGAVGVSTEAPAAPALTPVDNDSSDDSANDSNDATTSGDDASTSQPTVIPF